MVDDRPLTPAEVAAYFGVDVKTVRNWHRRGLLTAFRTPGGTRRYRRSDVVAAEKAARDRTRTPPVEDPEEEE